MAFSNSFHLNNAIAIGDRIILRPLNPTNQTSGGLYLPPSVKEKDEVQTGVVVKVGPGYPLPPNQDFDQFLKDQHSPNVQYLPLQVQEGDMAIYLQKHGHEIEIQDERYVIVNQSAILMVFREELGLDLL
jgi:co-chaperonin GroES (HSP10)